jgi:exodeoxyribonuclease VII large subunit
VIESRSVSWLARHIADLLAGDLAIQNLWVEGEISNLTRSQAGHVYFTLKEGDYSIRCVMFQRQYRGTPLENGAQVLAHGNVEFYERRGEIQVKVDFVQPAGVGARQAEFERLREKLAAEGLFDEGRKRPLPAFPTRIGVVTSPTGAVFHDICNVLSRRWPLAQVILAPTPVQGDYAAVGIAEGIRGLGRETGIDVIVIARGGGSMEELWPFNEEIVARAIFASPIPIVSAVGHETDFTIADFVADRRAPTPSAAAELVAPDWREVLRHVERMMLAGLLATKARAGAGATAVERAVHRLRAGLPDPARFSERLAALVRHVDAVVSGSLSRRSERANACALQLRSLDPSATLARGYAVVQLRDGKQAITSVQQVRGKDRLDVHVKDGRFPAEVARQYGF